MTLLIIILNYKNMVLSRCLTLNDIDSLYIPIEQSFISIHFRNDCEPKIVI